jgi:hypothetical protein
VVIVKNIKIGKGLKMKTKLKVITFYLLAVVLGGCIPVLSVHPLFSENELIFDPNLLGLWKAADSNQTWQFSRMEDPNVYELVITEKDGKQGTFLAGLGKLEGNLFLVIYPKEPQSMEQESGFYKQHILSLFSSMRVEQTDPNLKIAMMDYDKVNKIIKADPNILSYEIPDSKLILTAETEELQNFVIEYGLNVDDANSIFGGPTEFIWVAEDANDITTAEKE